MRNIFARFIIVLWAALSLLVIVSAISAINSPKKAYTVPANNIINKFDVWDGSISWTEPPKINQAEPEDNA